MKVKSSVKAGGIHLNHNQAVSGLRFRSKVTAGLTAVLLALPLAQGLVLADTGAEQARREREIQACIRSVKEAHQRALREAEQEKLRAERQADLDFKEAMHKAKHDAQRTAAKEARQKALLEAKDAFHKALMDARSELRTATDSCRNPKPPETAKNDPANDSPSGCAGADSTQGTLGHGPRPGGNSVRMDLRVVDEAGNPVRGAMTKLWSERQADGLYCETVHKTGECGNVLMDPIHITKTLQLKLDAKGFKPQVVQVDPARLDRPFEVVLRAK